METPCHRRSSSSCLDVQVYSAEEKAALAMYNFEENKRKEGKILSDMQLLVERTLGDKDDAAIGPAEAPDPEAPEDP